MKWCRFIIGQLCQQGLTATPLRPQHMVERDDARIAKRFSRLCPITNRGGIVANLGGRKYRADSQRVEVCGRGDRVGHGIPMSQLDNKYTAAYTF